VKHYLEGLENDGQSSNGIWKMADHVLRRIRVGKKDAYLHDETVTDVVRCALGLPLLPAHDIVGALQYIRITIATDGSHSRHLQQLAAYVKHQWPDRRSVGPNRLCVRNDRAPTNNILESCDFVLRRRIQVSHLNLFNFRMSPSTTRQTLQRLKRGVRIRRPKKTRNLLNDTRMKASRAIMPEHIYCKLQFVRAISHCKEF